MVSALIPVANPATLIKYINCKVRLCYQQYIYYLSNMLETVPSETSVLAFWTLLTGVV
eukprot:COSAG01_NODE_2840_length_6992_cov_2.267228_1_plen_58_part_00